MLAEALDAKIAFVYDIDDNSMSAYNASNVGEGYSGVEPEGDDVFLEFNEGVSTWWLNESHFCDHYDSAMSSYFLKSN